MMKTKLLKKSLTDVNGNFRTRLMNLSILMIVFKEKLAI